MALVFIVDYPDRWPSFISDVLSTLHTGPNAVELYLRLLLAIDTEVSHSSSSSCSSSSISSSSSGNCSSSSSNMK